MQKSEDMDTRISGWLDRSSKIIVATIAVIGFEYARYNTLERRLDSIEKDLQGGLENAKNTIQRVESLEADARNRVLIGADGGLARPDIRGAVNATIRAETKGLDERILSIRKELDSVSGLLERVIQANALNR